MAKKSTGKTKPAAGKKKVVVAGVKSAASTVKRPAPPAAKPVKPIKPIKSVKPMSPPAVVPLKPIRPTVVVPVTQSEDDETEADDTVVDVAPLTDDQLRKIKTGLSKKDLDHYRQLLLEKRSEILGDVASLEDGARNNGGGDLSNMPLHMADIGSDNYAQEFTLGLVESERKLLGEINEALLRINGGTYGVCIEKGVPINRARLDAKPWAKYCIEVAREREKRGLPIS